MAIYGIFTNRGDGCTYGYTKMEFITDDLTKDSVMDRLVQKLNLCHDEALELITNIDESLYFEIERCDFFGGTYNNIYIEELDLV